MDFSLVKGWWLRASQLLHNSRKQNWKNVAGQDDLFTDRSSISFGAWQLVPSINSLRQHCLFSLTGKGYVRSIENPLCPGICISWKTICANCVLDGDWLTVNSLFLNFQFEASHELNLMFWGHLFWWAELGLVNRRILIAFYTFQG